MIKGSVVIKKPHYHGHRKRLRKKFRESGKDAFHDYELIELLLTYAIPRGDVKPTAKRLIEKFDDLSGVLEANFDELVEINSVGEVTATFFPLINEINKVYAAEKMEDLDVLSAPESVANFVRLKIGKKDRETFMAIYVDNQNKVKGFEIIQKGTIDQVNIYPRELIKSALNHNAKGLILVHNHPSGELKPSASDIRLTEKIKDAVSTVNIDLLDHLIVTSESYRSIVD